MKELTPLTRQPPCHGVDCEWCMEHAVRIQRNRTDSLSLPDNCQSSRAMSRVSSLKSFLRPLVLRPVDAQSRGTSGVSCTRSAEKENYAGYSVMKSTNCVILVRNSNSFPIGNGALNLKIRNLFH